jgi:cytochrome c oxidase cbb3-type subunit 3
MNDQENKKPDEKDIDQISGVETTGHEWDGLKELNNPLPRWWVWVFLATCLWSLWYFIVYPAWPIPGGATSGTSDYTQFKELRESQAEIMQRQAAYLSDFRQASFNDIMADSTLYAFAMAGGKSAFKDNCATCHGSGAEGGYGYPNLNDDDWLWGGTIPDIYTTLLHGIRVQGSFETRLSQMPAYGEEGLLNREEINQMIDYVLALSGDMSDEIALEKRPGHEIFQQNCAACHGADGTGLYEFGAPNLTDKIWLYGGTRQDLYKTIYYSRQGMMPAWQNRLDNETIRQLSIYVHQLGGGEAMPEKLTEVIDENEPSSDNGEDQTL